MKRTGAQWIVVAAATLGLAAFMVILALNLVPSRTELLAKGSVAPWYVIWIFIWTTVACAVALAQFLLRAAAGKFAS